MEIKAKPQAKQFEAYQKWLDKITLYLLFGGGAGGGKSWWVCEKRLGTALSYPGSRGFIARKELKRLMSSTFITFQKVCKFYQIPQSEWTLNGQYNYIEFRNGSRIDLLDADYKPSDPEYDRFGSLEYTDGDIEEAQEIKEKAFDIFKIRVGRHRNREYGLLGKVGLTCNPNKGWLYRIFYKPWKEGKLPEEYTFIKALYTDNIYTAEEYGHQLSGIKDVQTRQRLRDGIWEYDESDNALLDYDSIIDLFTNSVPDGEKYISADIARYGSDKVRIGLWSGLNLEKAFSFEEQGIDATTIFLKTLAQDEQVPYSHIVVDDDGVGGGVVDNMKGIKGFVNNAAPLESGDEKENFQNLKTQCSYALADCVNQHKMAISAEVSEEEKNEIIEEVDQIRSKDKDQDSKKKIVPKEEVKENIGRSPDWADMLLMRMFFELKGSQKKSGFTVIRPQFSGYNRASGVKVIRPANAGYYRK